MNVTVPVNVTVSWQPPVNENGVILGYRLQFISFSGDIELDNATVSATTNTFTFSDLPPLSKSPSSPSALVVSDV